MLKIFTILVVMRRQVQNSKMQKVFKRRKPAKKATQPVEDDQSEDQTLKKSMLINSAVVTVRNPSKRVEGICKQLRKMLSPDCLFKIEMNPKLQDLLDTSNQLLVKQVIYISENQIKIANLPNGPTHTFQIVEYENNFKSFSNEIYKIPPFITVDGKSSLKPLFLEFGQNNQISKRVVHFHLKDDLIYIRHFTTHTEDLDDKFKVCMKEIGPRFTLKLSKTENGVFSDMGVKVRQPRE